MKIYILKVCEKCQPKSQIFVYPQGNNDFGVEQDFHLFLRNSNLLVDDPNDADWHYLPIYWTRWHLSHNYGKNGLTELNYLANLSIIDDKKTFTICQYDDGPLINLGNTKLFLASRNSNSGIDIPLLCKSHKKPFFRQTKCFKASFVGRLETNIIRKKMSDVLFQRSDVKIINEQLGTSEFVKLMLKSYVALSPRGYGGSSFRFFEAMQLGVVPLLIGDIDTRPFKNFLPWDEVSIYVKNPNELNSILDSKSNEDLLKMGLKASEVYHNYLTYERWCQFVIKELDHNFYE
jgi:hypothetical protein